MGEANRRRKLVGSTIESLKPKGDKYKGPRGSRAIKWLTQGTRKTFHK